jgi:nitroreductase
MPTFVPLCPYSPELPPLEAAEAFRRIMAQRRTVRTFDDAAVPLELIESCVRSAATAPSGANKQPWRFVCVSDPKTKREIRLAAEAEERRFYAERASEQWLADLEPLGTDDQKPFLEEAPWLVVLFRLTRGDDGGQVYYSNESVGLAAGFFLAAAHHAGLATLTHTPSPMGFLTQVLERPEHERPFLLIPVGWPAPNTVIPEFAKTRKPLDQVMVVRGSK